MLICSQISVCDISNLLCTHINKKLFTHIAIEKSLRLYPRYNITVYVRKVLNLAEHIIRVSSSNSVTSYHMRNFAPIYVITDKHTLIPYVDEYLCARVLIAYEKYNSNPIVFVYCEKTPTYFTDLMDIFIDFTHDVIETSNPYTHYKIRREGVAATIRDNIMEHKVNRDNTHTNQEITNFIQNILQSFD